MDSYFYGIVRAFLGVALPFSMRKKIEQVFLSSVTFSTYVIFLI